MPTRAVQDYLKAIHRLGGAEVMVSPVDIAARLAEVHGDGLFEARRNGVFQGLRLGVHLAPVEAEDAREK